MSNSAAKDQWLCDVTHPGEPCPADRPAASLHRGPHEVGKPCPEKPWMIVTTFDWQKSVCGACGRKLYATA